MAAPTQAYPPWLSPQTVTVTQNGVVTLQTSVVQLPQTYYGPSIPLGPNWVFGGSTFPASIATSFSVSSAPTPSTSTTPTISAAPTSSQSQTSSPSSSASFPSSSLSSTTSLSTPTTSSTSASPSASNVSRRLSSGTRLAIILSTILGTLMLAVLLLVLFRIRRRVLRRRGLTGNGGISWSFINRSAIEQNIEPGGGDGEGAESEGAAFIPVEQRMQEHVRRPVSLPAWLQSPREPSPVPESIAQPADSQSRSTGTKSDSSTLDSEAKREDIARFNASSSTADAGSLFFNPGRGNGESSTVRQLEQAAADEPTLAMGTTTALEDAARLPGAVTPLFHGRSPSRPIAMPTAPYFQPESPRSARDDQAPYDSNVQRFDALGAREGLEDAEDRLLPPRLLDPDNTRTSQAISSGSRGSWSYPDSPPSETDERATLLTARRVNLGQVSSMLASPDKKGNSEGWTTPPNETEEDSRSVSPGSWSVNVSGLAGFAKGLGRLSWFRRMDNDAGPSGTRHSSPTRSRRGTDSRPSSGRPGSAPRPHSGLLRPPFGSRPQSGVSFHSIDAELGLRPPGARISAAGSGSGSGSGKSGATAYHSASSRPRTPHLRSSAEYVSHEERLAHAEPTSITLPPDLDLGEGRTTVRSVDVLDLPIPEPSLPFGPTLLPDISSRSTMQGTVSSRGTSSGVALTFPPGLISVPKWDKASHSGSSNRDTGDVLEEEPPQAGGEWSSLRSKTSASDVKDEGVGSRQKRRGLVTRSGTGEQAVQVIQTERAPSETASIATGPRQPPNQRALAAPISLRSPRSLPAFGISLTPPVSMYASSRSDVASHSGDGSYSSQPSHTASHSGNGSYSSQPSHTASHLQEVSRPSSNQGHQESDDGHPPLPQGTGYNRASLSAIGGEQSPPQIPPLRPLSTMQSVLERTAEDRETEGSDTSRPGTGTSKPISELTRTGTFTSVSGSTGVQTTVPSTTDSSGKP